FPLTYDFAVSLDSFLLQRKAYPNKVAFAKLLFCIHPQATSTEVAHNTGADSLDFVVEHQGIRGFNEHVYSHKVAILNLLPLTHKAQGNGCDLSPLPCFNNGRSTISAL